MDCLLHIQIALFSYVAILKGVFLNQRIVISKTSSTNNFFGSNLKAGDNRTNPIAGSLN